METPFGIPAEDYYALKKVVHKTEVIRSARDLNLFTQSWLPASEPPRAILCICHGYGNDTSWLIQVTAIEFAAHGLAVFAIDYQGHGQSDGLRCSVRRFDDFVDDSYAHFKSVREQAELAGLRCFLYGESLGGAVVIRMFKKDPAPWNGAVLASPMVKIGEHVRPHWAVAQVLRSLVYVVPDAPLVPYKNDVGLVFRDPKKAEIAMHNPNRYNGRTRLGFAQELLNVTAEIQADLEGINFPFLIIHGEEDQVTDPLASKELYEKSSSKDKTLKLYPKALHLLLSGEPAEAEALIWKDVFSWLDQRIKGKQ